MKSAGPDDDERRAARRVDRPDRAKRWVSHAAQRAVDLLSLGGAFVVAFVIRFDGDPPWRFWKMALLGAPYVALFEYGLLSAFGVPQFAWRYVGLREAVRIAQALALGTLALIAVRLVAPELERVHPAFRFAIIPFGVIAIDAVLALALVVGTRTLRRAIVERREREDRGAIRVEGSRTLIVGAGEEGLGLARTIDQHPELGVDPIGFVDDDASKHGSRIHGLRVLGGFSSIAEVCRRYEVEQAILALPEDAGARIRDILADFDDVSVPVKVVPTVSSLVTAGSASPALRPIELEDLLRRPSVALPDEPIDELVEGRVVLVTGAGGSIGSELCRQIARHGASTLVLVERSEHALYEIARELATASANIVPLLADVTERGRIGAIFDRYAPSVVFHAAAHKHVPMLETQAAEAVRNNVLGTTIVADAAVAHRASAFVLVSTDKAVNPSSIMGASKRAAEIYLQSISHDGPTRLVAVRFGNVLGSSGSVVPLFREQIARGGPVTVTHPEMRRYFMTIPEACNLVLHAGALGSGGEIFILDMGDPVRIADLAEDLIRLSGYVPGRDISIEYTGLRPGEKLFEELSVDAERADKTRHPKIFVARIRGDATPATRDALARLLRAADSRDDDAVVRILGEVVPELVRPVP